MNAAATARRVALCTFMGGLGGGLVFPILPALGLELGISGGMIGLILSANRISRLIFDTPAGHIIDRVGGKQAIAFGLLVEGIGVLGYSAALHLGHPTFWLLTGRVVFGIGSAFLFVGAQATVLSLSSQADRGRRTATVRIAMSAGMPGGLVMGGIIADRFSDNTAFLTGAFLTFLGALVAFLLIPPIKARLHAPAADGPRGLRSRMAALVALPEFPLLASAWGFNTLVFLSMQGVLLATLVILVQERGFHLFGMAAQGTAGLVMAALMGCSSITALALGRGIDRLRLRSSLLVPSVLGVALGFAVIGLAHDLLGIFVGAILVGVFFNGINLPMLALLGDVSRPEHYGRVVGMYQLFGDLGGSLGPILGIEAGLRFGLASTYLGVAALLALSIVAAVWVRRREHQMRLQPG